MKKSTLTCTRRAAYASIESLMRKFLLAIAVYIYCRRHGASENANGDDAYDGFARAYIANKLRYLPLPVPPLPKAVRRTQQRQSKKKAQNKTRSDFDFIFRFEFTKCQSFQCCGLL